MWTIEKFALPFSNIRDSMAFYWKAFVENLEAPYVFLGKRIMAILDGVSLLTSAEISDVEASWKEIEKGQTKKFRSVDEFLEELKS